MILNQHNLAIKVKELLRETKMSKESFAININKSTTYVDKLLEGRANPTIKMIIRIFSVFDKKVNFNLE